MTKSKSSLPARRGKSTATSPKKPTSRKSEIPPEPIKKNIFGVELIGDTGIAQAFFNLWTDGNRLFVNKSPITPLEALNLLTTIEYGFADWKEKDTDAFVEHTRKTIHAIAMGEKIVCDSVTDDGEVEIKDGGVIFRGAMRDQVADYSKATGMTVDDIVAAALREFAARNTVHGKAVAK